MAVFNCDIPLRKSSSIGDYQDVSNKIDVHIVHIARQLVLFETENGIRIWANKRIANMILCGQTNGIFLVTEKSLKTPFGDESSLHFATLTTR